MHHQSTQWGKDNSAEIKIILGKWLFFIYLLFYAGFILINIWSPSFMAIDVGPLNVAITYGFGLIVFAIILAFAYNHVCNVAEDLLNTEDHTEGQ
jgi:uncharacterized membrane protein (DUF485 family)